SSPTEATHPPLVSERSDRELGLEVCTVLAVVVLPTLFTAVTPLLWPRAEAPVSSIYDSIYLLVREVGPVALILYLVHRSGEPPARIGLDRPRGIGDVLTGGGIWFADYLVWLFVATNCWWGVLALASAFPLPYPPAAFPVPARWYEFLLAALACCAVGFSEELITRGFMFSRLEQLLRSTWKALVITTALFASWHVYQGMRGVVSAGVTGLVYGAAFWWLRRIWPVAIAHAVADFVAATRML